MNNGSFVNHVAAGQMNSGEGLQDDGDLLLPTEPIGHTAMPQEAIFVPAPPSQALVLPTSVAAPQQHSIFASDQPFREVRPVATYAQNQPQMEAPSRTPASSGPASSSGGRRPMRQSRLRHRNFDLELEEEEQEEEEFYKPKGGKKGAQVQRPQSAAFEPKRAPIVRQRPSPPQQQVALAAPRMMPFCVIDLPCPRRGRSVGGTRPRSGRASMNRLKQAAHGNLPIGGNPALVLMGGNASPAASAGRGDFSDDDDSDGGRRSGKRRRQSQSNRSDPSTVWLQNQNQGHFSSQGPSEIQRQRMQEIANAPPHLRQAMLQRLMQQQLGEPVPPTPTAPLSLAQLPRSEQQAVVQQLMARMTPQQRHSLLELPTQQQAIFLQQYYQQHVMPARQVAPVLPPQPAPLSAMGPPPFPAISRAPPVQAPSRGQDVIVRPLLAEEELLFLEREPQMRALLSRLSPQQRQQFGELNPDAQRFFLVQLYKEHELKRQPPVSAANPPPQTQFGPASVASAPNSTYNLPMLPSATGGPIGQVPPQTQPLAPAPGWAGVGAPASTAAPMAPTMPAPAPAPVPAPAPAPPAMPPAIPGASGQGSLTAVVTQPGSMSAPATGILSGGRPSFTMLGSAREPITMPNIFPEAGAVPAQGPAGPAALMGPVITEAGVVGSKDGLFLDGAGLGDDVAQDDLNEAMEYFLN